MIRDFLRLFPAYIWAIIVGLIVLALVWAVWAWRHDRQEAADARAGRAVAEGDAAATRATIQILGEEAQREAAIDAQTRTNDAAIRSAEGADARVPAGVNDAGLVSLCKRRAYADDPACERLRRAHP
jgi:hypothetical protein